MSPLQKLESPTTGDSPPRTGGIVDVPCPHTVATNLRCDACGAFLGVGVYPGDEPCQCGAVTITGHYLSDRTERDDGDTVHYRASDGTPCEETP